MNEKINKSKDMQPSNATLGVFSGKFLVKKTWFMINLCLLKNIKSFCFFKVSKSKFADFTV